MRRASTTARQRQALAEAVVYWTLGLRTTRGANRARWWQPEEKDGGQWERRANDASTTAVSGARTRGGSAHTPADLAYAGR